MSRLGKSNLPAVMDGAIAALTTLPLVGTVPTFLKGYMDSDQIVELRDALGDQAERLAAIDEALEALARSDDFVQRWAQAVFPGEDPAAAVSAVRHLLRDAAEQATENDPDLALTR